MFEALGLASQKGRVDDIVRVAVGYPDWASTSTARRALARSASVDALDTERNQGKLI